MHVDIVDTTTKDRLQTMILLIRRLTFLTVMAVSSNLLCGLVLQVTRLPAILSISVTSYYLSIMLMFKYNTPMFTKYCESFMNCCFGICMKSLPKNKVQNQLTEIQAYDLNKS